MGKQIEVMIDAVDRASLNTMNGSAAHVPSLFKRLISDSESCCHDLIQQLKEKLIRLDISEVNVSALPILIRALDDVPEKCKQSLLSLILNTSFVDDKEIVIAGHSIATLVKQYRSYAVEQTPAGIGAVWVVETYETLDRYRSKFCELLLHVDPEVCAYSARILSLLPHRSADYIDVFFDKINQPCNEVTYFDFLLMLGNLELQLSQPPAFADLAENRSTASSRYESYASLIYLALHGHSAGLKSLKTIAEDEESFEHAAFVDGELWNFARCLLLRANGESIFEQYEL